MVENTKTQQKLAELKKLRSNTIIITNKYLLAANLDLLEKKGIDYTLQPISDAEAKVIYGERVNVYYDPQSKAICYAREPYGDEEKKYKFLKLVLPEDFDDYYKDLRFYYVNVIENKDELKIQKLMVTISWLVLVIGLLGTTLITITSESFLFFVMGLFSTLVSASIFFGLGEVLKQQKHLIKMIETHSNKAI